MSKTRDFTAQMVSCRAERQRLMTWEMSPSNLLITSEETLMSQRKRLRWIPITI